MSIIPWFIYNICIIYLHVIEAACLKVTIAMFYFFHSKNPLSIINIIFNSSLYIFLKKFLLTNVRNKCLMRKMNLYFMKS